MHVAQIHVKPRKLVEFVVEGAAVGVGGLGGSVNTRAIPLGSDGIHSLDKVCSDALAAMLGGDECSCR
jgi:hypothetical protein